MSWLAQLSRREQALLLLACVILIAHSLIFNFVTDDAFISFVFARNFAEHGELVFNLSDRVEGYTNFLWTVLLGLLMKVGLAPEWTSRVLGTAFALGTMVIVTRTMTRLLPSASAGPRVLPALLLGLSSGFACWSSGGLETQCFSFWVAAAVDAYIDIARAPEPTPVRRSLWLGAALGLAGLTRPEGLLIAALLGAHWATHSWWRRRSLAPTHAQWLALAGLLALLVPFFAWRISYYGYPVPNTYYVKAHGPWQPASLAREMLENGIYYVWAWAQQTGTWLVAPLLVSSLWLAGARRATSLLLVLALGYASYVVSVGGDFMGLYRFILPVTVWVAMLVGLGIAALPTSWRARTWLPFLLLVGFAGWQARSTRAAVRWGNFANDRGIDTPAFLMAYTEDRAIIGRAMAPCFLPTDFSIVGGAGAQPYYGRMRAIDVFGLVSSKIAHEEPRIRARAGHTKFGRDGLLLSYDPTFVFSCYDLRRTDDPAPLPCGAFWKPRGYEQVTMHVPGLRERGEYYVFLAKKDRAFACPGRVR